MVFGLFAAALIGTAVDPPLDLIVSGWFYKPGEGFYLAEHPAPVFLHMFAVRGAWTLGIFCAIFLPVAALRRRGFGGLRAKGWLYLLLALLIGPVLIANVALKDHWGRARPRELTEFGSYKNFSPALVPQAYPEPNESFVSGDGAFGFYLPCFAYLVPLGARSKESRRVFWLCMAGGVAIGAARVAMGAHFLSDVLFAGLLMLGVSAALHAIMYGKKSTRDYWRCWMGRPNSSPLEGEVTKT
jgi:lipid A 4'-phosphatase